MSEIVTRDAARDFPRHAAPAIPAELLASADKAIAGVLVAPLTPALCRELEACRSAVALATRPARQAQCWTWLRGLARLARLARMPASDEEWEIACRGAWLACGELPAGVWCLDTQAEMLRRTAFWPTPKDIYEVLQLAAEAIRKAEYRVGALRRHEDALRAARAAADAQAAEPKADPEAVSRAVRQMLASLHAASFGAGRPMGASSQEQAVVPRPDRLSQRAVLMHLEREAAQGASADIRARAAARLAHLRPVPEQEPVPTGAVSAA